MKTAISIPEDVFSRAEEFARRRKMTRSALFTMAVDEFVQNHRKQRVTEKLDEVYSSQASSLDPVLSQLQGLSVTKEQW